MKKLNHFRLLLPLAVLYYPACRYIGRYGKNLEELSFSNKDNISSCHQQPWCLLTMTLGEGGHANYCSESIPLDAMMSLSSHQPLWPRPFMHSYEEACISSELLDDRFPIFKAKYPKNLVKYVHVGTYDYSINRTDATVLMSFADVKKELCHNFEVNNM